jgi:hypothetical protein
LHAFNANQVQQEGQIQVKHQISICLGSGKERREDQRIQKAADQCDE